ncbi:MAG TPA: hypothetical protein VNN08_09110, partial [Thermoanaerobaculia bacterium]|nr:hypothetical protein [Thermoanaerobaculia bacterium]
MKARILIPLLVLVFAALAAPAFAVDPTCIPPATGVFGDATPPHWWDGTGQAAYYNSPDDPRWVGSGAITLADGASTEADFRGLYSGTDLYLSWRVYVAPTGVAIQNHLYLGFVQAGGTAMVIDVTPPDTLLGNDITPTIVVHELQSNGQLGALIAPPPPWLTDARVWINQPLSNFWAFEMRVPTSAITIPGNTFSMWFELLAGTPDTHDHAYTWPDNTTGEIIGADPNVFGDVDHYPWTDQWQQFHLSTGPGDTSCAGGVSLDVYQIGVR